MKIFLTGSEGLIGKAIRKKLEARGFFILGCDLRASRLSERYDLRDAKSVRKNLFECDGVIHLGAVSRVIWGEHYANLCRSINIDGARLITQTVAESRRKPWLLFASSREIYGTPLALPCTPDTPPNPENTYAKSKLAGEKMALALQTCGNRVIVLRFSNVFGTTDDYNDRVVPAFAKAAAQQGDLHVRGESSVFDFTVLDDVVMAVLKSVDALNANVGDLPPIDIVTGQMTSLRDLAEIAIDAGGGKIIASPPLAFYPQRFQGDPRPAKKYLEWSPQWELKNAVHRLVEDFKRLGGKNAYPESHSWISALL